MRILIATPQIGHAWGGSGTYVYELSSVLGRSHDISIVTAGSEPSVPGAADVRAISPAVGVMGTYALFQISLRRRFSELVRDIKPDVMLVNHTEMSDLLCPRGPSVPPVVVTAHTSLRTQVQSALAGRFRGNSLDRSEVALLSLSAALLPVEAVYWRRTRHAIFVSNWIRREILGSLSTNLRASVVIPNGVSMQSLSTELPLPVPEGNDGPMQIVFVGRLLATKGLAVLFAALRRLLDLDWRCVVVGPGPAASWTRKAREFGIGSRVQFLGQLDRSLVLRIMKNSDIFVIPSFSESCPYTLLEAMRCSLPLVASRVGDIPEILEDGRGGLLFDPGDSEGLAHRLRMLLTDERLRTTLRNGAREIINRRFTSEIMGASTLRFLEGVLASESQGG